MEHPPTFNLAICQMAVAAGEPERNRATAAQMIAEAARLGAEVALLPECCDLGWTDPSAHTRAEPVPGGATFRALAEAARTHGLYVCAGLVERDGLDVYNTAVLIGPDGELLRRHRKLNELEIGHPFYAQGDRLGVARTPLATFGVMICADAFARDLVITRTLGHHPQAGTRRRYHPFTVCLGRPRRSRQCAGTIRSAVESVLRPACPRLPDVDHLMQLPSYFLPQPAANWDENTIASFDQLFAQIAEQEPGAIIDYRLPAPKWQFLCYLCDRRRIVLHGSGEAEIAEFEPRQSNDVGEFGNRRAVYAASDGIWAIYFAIVDRDRYVTSLINGCFRVLEPGGKSGPHYFFSINQDALPHNPWRHGMIYLLPRDSFEPQPLQEYRGAAIEIAQWASLVPVRPLAKLAVGPEDFPFLDPIRSHDPAVIRDRARADPDGFPWLD